MENNDAPTATEEQLKIIITLDTSALTQILEKLLASPAFREKFMARFTNIPGLFVITNVDNRLASGTLERTILLQFSGSLAEFMSAFGAG